MNTLGVLLIFLGILLMVLGLDISGRIGPLGKLPGDILIERGGLTFYFPLGTSIFLSVLFTILFLIFNRIFK